ncbi:hypothetical protein J4231_03160, partial [Candidatus Woesearchaeota archaeon]|nr:hypothetical protein [Candidatus Woesearchaeota archaeon]
IENSYFVGTVDDIHIPNVLATANVTCLNCSLKGINSTITISHPLSNITIKEYTRINVTNSSGAVSSANVTVNSSLNAFVSGQLTGNNGLTEWKKLEYFIKNYTATIYSVNYTILAKAEHHLDANATWNVSQFKSYNINLTIVYLPGIYDIQYFNSSYADTANTNLTKVYKGQRLDVRLIAGDNDGNDTITDVEAWYQLPNNTWVNHTGTISYVTNTYFNYSITVPNDITGTMNFTFNVTSGDSLDNTRREEYAAVEIINTKPTADVIYPVNGSYLRNNTVMFNISVDDLNQDSLTVYFIANTSAINKTYSNVSGYNLLNYTYTFNDGLQNWTANLTDGIDTNTNATTFFIIDTVLPIVTYNTSTAANNTYTNSSNAIVNISVSESYMDNMTFELFTASAMTNKTVMANDNMNNYSINFSIATDGTYYYNASMYDRSGNYNATDARAIAVDRTIPVATYNTSTGANNSIVDQNYILVNISVDETNLGNITFRLYNQTALLNTTIYTGNNRSINWSAPSLDDVYIYNASIYDLAGNINQTDTRRIRLDSTWPSALITYPSNGSNIASIGDAIVNWSISDGNLEVCWYNLNNYTNMTLDCNAGYSNNLTFIRGWNNFTAYANDSVGHENKSVTASFLIDNIPTVPTLIMPENDTQKLVSNVTFLFNSNDSDGDAITYNVVIANDSAFSFEIDNKYVSANNSYKNITMPQGILYYKVRSNDSYTDSNFSQINRFEFVNATVTIYSPANITVIYPAQTVSIYLREDSRQDWITNVTLTVTGDGVNEEYQMSNQTASENTTWKYNYVVPTDLEPSILTVVAKTYNGTFGDFNSTIVLVVTRTLGSSVSVPRIVSFETYPTYTTQNSSVNISIYAATDTVLTSTTTTITLPNGTNYDMSYSEYSKTALNYTYNYTINATDIGNYSVSTTIIDANSQQATATRSFFVTPNVTVTISPSSVNNTIIRDISSRRAILQGATVTEGLPRGKYDVEFTINDAQSMILENSTINESYTGSFNYSNLDESTGPTDTRTLDRFQLDNNIDNKQSNITYNYTASLSTITNENNIKFYKCSSTSNCSWAEVTTSVDADSNIATGLVTGFSVFSLSESVATTTTTTTTTVGGGGGGSGSVGYYYDMNIITPTPFYLGLNTKAIVPIMIKNNGQIGLSNIQITAIPNETGITVRPEMAAIPYLDVNREQSVDFAFETSNATRSYSISIKAESMNPSLAELAYVYINAGTGSTTSNKTIIIERIKFVKDLFKENPECLELNEIIKQAEESLSEGRLEKSMALTETAINACKDLVTSKGKVLKYPVEVYDKKSILILVSIVIILAIALIVSIFLMIKKRKKDRNKRHSNEKKLFAKLGSRYENH